MVVYKEQFKAMSIWLKDLSERHKLSCLLSGKWDKIQLPMRMLNPINLGSAFGLAKTQEEYILSLRRLGNTVVGVERRNLMKLWLITLGIIRIKAHL